MIAQPKYVKRDVFFIVTIESTAPLSLEYNLYNFLECILFQICLFSHVTTLPAAAAPSNVVY